MHLARAEDAMHVYRCYFLNQDDRIRAFENIEADALTEALDRAFALLREQPEHHAIEIWNGAIRVYRGQAENDPDAQYQATREGPEDEGSSDG
jgi:hypothetical protein